MRTLLALLALTLVASGCSEDDPVAEASRPTEPGTVAFTIGAQAFGESRILAEIYAQGLTAAGYEVHVHQLEGYRPAELEAFRDGVIDLAPEYAASMLEELNDNAGQATGDPVETVRLLQQHLDLLGLRALTPADAIDTNAFVLTRATAERLRLVRLSDLAALGPQLRLGAPADCPTNPFCAEGLHRVYGVDLRDRFQALEPAEAPGALDQGLVDLAVMFSTDARIKANGYVLLHDDKQMLAAENIVPVLTRELAGNRRLVMSIDTISAELTTELLTAMNKRHDVDREDPAVIAREFLHEAGLR